MQFVTTSSRYQQPACASSRYQYAATASIRIVYPLVPFLLNFTALTHLTGGTATALDGLSATVLATLGDNTRAVLGFANGIVAQYRLRPRGADVEAAPWLIVADNAPTRAWQLEQVTKEGAPCNWQADQQKFFQQLAPTIDGVPALTLADAGFVLPTIAP